MKNLTIKFQHGIVFALLVAMVMMLAICGTVTANAAEVAEDYAANETAEIPATEEVTEDPTADEAMESLAADEDAENSLPQKDPADNPTEEGPYGAGWVTITVDYVHASTECHLLPSMAQRVRFGDRFVAESPAIYGYVPEQRSVSLDEALGSQHLTVKYDTLEERAEKDQQAAAEKRHKANLIYGFSAVSLLSLAAFGILTAREKVAAKNSEDDWATGKTAKKRDDWMD